MPNAGKDKNNMTVREAGHLGGEAPHPHGRGLQNADDETRRRVAHRGGQTVKELIEKGKDAEK